MRKIALFGGSFNPPHVGHQFMVFYLSHSFDFEEIWINPVYKHRFEKDKYLINSYHRLEMSKLAFAKISDKVKIKDIDIKNNFSKTYDTVNFLKRKNIKNEINITLVLGEDNYESRHKWYKFKEIEKMTDILYLGRATTKSNLVLPFKFPDISSSKIRENIIKNHDKLDKEVLNYIIKNKLYEIKN